MYTYRVLEPAVTLSDYVLAAGCASAAWWCGKRSTRGRGWWTGFFAMLGVAGAAGGTSHGYFPTDGEPIHDALWLATLLALGGTAWCMWGIAGAVAGGRARRVPWWLAPLHLFYAIAVIAIAQSAPPPFRWAIACYLPATLALLAVFAWRARSERASAWAAAGVVLTLAAAAVQVLEIAVHPRWFDHNALYHTVQVAGLALLLPAALSPGTR